MKGNLNPAVPGKAHEPRAISGPHALTPPLFQRGKYLGIGYTVQSPLVVAGLGGVAP
jgi:hypothetical protein